MEIFVVINELIPITNAKIVINRWNIISTFWSLVNSSNLLYTFELPESGDERIF